MRTKVMLCTACALVVGAAPAQAAFPGKNGRIAVTSDRPSPYDKHVGDMDIWTFGPTASTPATSRRNRRARIGIRAGARTDAGSSSRATPTRAVTTRCS